MQLKEFQIAILNKLKQYVEALEKAYAYVFAMACFVPPEDLPQKGLVFCQMPFQIHKMLIRMLT